MVGKQQLGKLIHLALLQMISANLQTRFNAFQMIQAVTRDYISVDEGRKLLNFRFAFESHIARSILCSLRKLLTSRLFVAGRVTTR